MPKRAGNIYPLIYDIENIKMAHRMARKDKSFYDAVKKTDENLDERAKEISIILKNHTYKVGLYKTSRYYDRGKERILYKLPYYPDRIIQWAIMLQIEKYFKKVFVPFTCASIPQRGIHQASQLLDKYLANDPVGTQYCLKIDIKKFYPSIDRKILCSLLRKIFKDKDLLYELDNIINSFDNNDSYKLNLSDKEKAIYCQPGKGVPVGSYLSQYLANFYLAYFDHWLIEECHCKYVIRYMDDLIILHESKIFLHNLLCAIKFYLKIELHLTIKDNYIIFPAWKGIDFVGYKHFYGYKLLRTCSKIRFKRILIASKNLGLQLDDKHWCGCISICGWLSWANTFKFSQKYLFPLIGPIGMYYHIVKKTKNRKAAHSILIWDKFYDSYYTHKKHQYQTHIPLHFKNRI